MTKQYKKYPNGLTLNFLRLLFSSFYKSHNPNFYTYLPFMETVDTNVFIFVMLCGIFFQYKPKENGTLLMYLH